MRRTSGAAEGARQPPSASGHYPRGLRMGIGARKPPSAPGHHPGRHPRFTGGHWRPPATIRPGSPPRPPRTVCEWALSAATRQPHRMASKPSYPTHSHREQLPRGRAFRLPPRPRSTTGGLTPTRPAPEWHQPPWVAGNQPWDRARADLESEPPRVVIASGPARACCPQWCERRARSMPRGLVREDWPRDYPGRTGEGFEQGPLPHPPLAGNSSRSAGYSPIWLQSGGNGSLRVRKPRAAKAFSRSPG
ncbi:hypothetical protein SAMN06264365_1069 [Actinoplanes regularis]|uniref:Uncharacterized protein n=1 Tax=Actinoplanes regularis TaxID=52697 RepID=A0A238ZH17_9ACTN|nr:hypothetical protein SAMN06264365_1069 [Actinoplanes regularis]